MSPLIVFLVTLTFLIFILAYFKLPSILGLFLSAVLAGLLSGLNMKDLTGALSAGFGGTLSAMGLVCAFGTMLSVYLDKSGGIIELAKWAVRKFGKEKDMLAVGGASYLISIPVFYGVAFYLLAPLNKELSKMTRKSLMGYLCSMNIGLLLTHCVVAPTPGPLAVGMTLGINLGWFIIYGLLVTIIPFFLFAGLYPRLLERNCRKQGIMMPSVTADDITDEDLLRPDPNHASAGTTIFCILFPVVLILLGTIMTTIFPSGAINSIFTLVGNNNVAMCIAFLTAALLLKKYIPGKLFGDAWKESLHGMDILVILGAGGCLAKVIVVSGIGDYLCAIFTSLNLNIFLVAFLMTIILRVALSSGTTAMLTSVAIFAPVAQAAGESLVLIGLTICSACVGGLIHTDSAFWMIEDKYEASQGEILRAVSLPSTLCSVCCLLCILLLNMFAGSLPGLM